MHERWIEPRCGVCLTAKSRGCECETKFSQDFRNMLHYLDVEKVIEGSHVCGANFEVWEHHRKFIADAINQSGSVLDIGCANGFLLRSLQEWSEYDLDPYGIDPSEKLLQQSDIIFPQLVDHFARKELVDLQKQTPKGFPDQFGFVVWAVWDDIIQSKWNTRTHVLIEIARKLVKPGGRLIITAYDIDVEKNDRVGMKLRMHGYDAKTIKNSTAHPERVFVIDIPTE